MKTGHIFGVWSIKRTFEKRPDWPGQQSVHNMLCTSLGFIFIPFLKALICQSENVVVE